MSSTTSAPFVSCDHCARINKGWNSGSQTCCNMSNENCKDDCLGLEGNSGLIIGISIIGGFVGLIIICFLIRYFVKCRRRNYESPMIPQTNYHFYSTASETTDDDRRKREAEENRRGGYAWLAEEEFKKQQAEQARIAAEAARLRSKY